MMYLVYFLSFAFVVSVVGVSVNPLPQLGAGALVLAAAFSCGMLASAGGSFMSIILLLIYLGGMLVVFAYSVALSSGAYSLLHSGGWPVGVRLFVFLCLMLCLVNMCNELYGVGFKVIGVGEFCGSVAELVGVQVDLFGVPLLYYVGMVGLFVCVFCLFLCLFVVLGLSRGVSRGSLRVF